MDFESPWDDDQKENEPVIAESTIEKIKRPTIDMVLTSISVSAMLIAQHFGDDKLAAGDILGYLIMDAVHDEGFEEDTKDSIIGPELRELFSSPEGEKYKQHLEEALDGKSVDDQLDVNSIALSLTIDQGGGFA